MTSFIPDAAMSKKRKTWSQSDLDFLRSACQTELASSIAKKLGTTPHSVRMTCKRYGIPFKREIRPRVSWSNEQVEFLRINSSNMTVAQMASRFGVSKQDVINKLRAEGLGFSKVRKEWTSRDVYELLLHTETKGRSEVASKIDRSLGSVHTKLKQLGVKSFAGRYSLQEAIRATGYCAYQLQRARRALDQQWTKVKWKTTGRFIITCDQLDEMCDWLKEEK